MATTSFRHQQVKQRNRRNKPAPAGGYASAENSLAKPSKVPGSGDLISIRQLQGSLGNRFVQRLISSSLEEADTMMPAGAGPEGGILDQDLSGQIQNRRGMGTRLDAKQKSKMETVFDFDLDDVRLHKDEEADALSLSLNAKAFTIGGDIFFSHLASPDDTALLAHELTHVVQQNAMTPDGPMKVGAANDDFEQQADHFAEQAAAHANTTVDGSKTPAADTGNAASPGGRGAAVQRSIFDMLSDVGNVAGVGSLVGSALEGLDDVGTAAVNTMMGTSTSASQGAAISGVTQPLGAVTSGLGAITGAAGMSDAATRPEAIFDTLSDVGNVAGVGSLVGSALEGLDDVGTAAVNTMMGTSTSASQGAALSSITQPLGVVTSGLGLITGAAGMYDAATRPGTFGLDDLTDFGVNAASAVSGLTGALGSLGIGGIAAGGEAGLAATALGSGAMGSAGAFGTAGAALGSAGAVLGAGAAGYGAGRLIDEGVGGLMNITGLSASLDEARGISRPEGQSGDYSLSGMGADLMTGADETITGAMRGLGLYDEDRPAYTQSIGWRLAEALPSWMQ